MRALASSRRAPLTLGLNGAAPNPAFSNKTGRIGRQAVVHGTCNGGNGAIEAPRNTP
jgi:hypothetical protein